jgi:hypothetical protein
MSNRTSDSTGQSILKGVVDIIDKRLELKVIGKPPQYGHKKSCQNLVEPPLGDLVMETLIDEIYEQIKSNWKDSDYHRPSKENWRFKKQNKLGGGNKKEVAFERAIVNIPAEIWPDATCWVNQVPTASGFVAPAADKRCAIDLVYRRGSDSSDSYEFIELKVDEESGGTPLFAAMEILQHGLLYIFAREHEEARYVPEQQDLLRATNIHLRVLAPASYYAGCDLAWLEKHIDRGLANFLSKHEHSRGLEMKFRFEALTLTLTRSSPWVPSGPKQTSP